MEKTLVNGVELAYQRIGDGKPLVLLHGFPLDHVIWDEIIPYLKNDIELIIPDLRGFGSSQIKDEVYTLDDMAVDISALLHQLKLDKAYIAGHSMGGYIALAFARLFPYHMLGLGLIASQAIADSPEKQTSRHEDATRVLAHGPQVFQGMAEKLTADPRLQAYLRPIILRQNAFGLASALKAMAARSNSTGFLADFALPLVLIHGEGDVLIPPEQATTIKQIVPSAHLCLMPGCGHMPMIEAPAATAEALKKLL